MSQATFTDKRSKVMPDIRTSQLVVVATEKEMADVDQLVERLDTQTKQVLIEARLLETIVNPSTTKALTGPARSPAQNVTFGNGVTSGNSARLQPELQPDHDHLARNARHHDHDVARRTHGHQHHHTRVSSQLTRRQFDGQSAF